jgi:selenium metabolism protein YedF
MKIVDCRNLACPAPVINVKKALEEGTDLQILVDDGAPHENVARFLRNRNYQVIEQRDGIGWLLTISGTLGNVGLIPIPSSHGSRILLITSDRIGDGPEELGRLLMKNFIHTLLETKDIPSRIIFLNTGVFLTCEVSDVREALEKLHGAGVEIFSCGLCLDFFKLKDQLRAGTITNMLVTVESLLSAEQVIKL